MFSVESGLHSQNVSVFLITAEMTTLVYKLAVIWVIMITYIFSIFFLISRLIIWLTKYQTIVKNSDTMV